MRQWSRAFQGPDLQTSHDASTLISAMRSCIDRYPVCYFLNRQELRAFSAFLDALIALSGAGTELTRFNPPLLTLQDKIINSSMGLMLRQHDLELLDHVLLQLEATLRTEKKIPLPSS
ncbi:hypothetical protein PT277_06795 [Acetobacteraceae bacterium ESL0709]|nr:hypothetical protein [Acetobacteraceae bacterium ESL0697]MDF7678402.1 hypothetical protein [Acetobacteraceae bacterium ESL0709]